MSIITLIVAVVALVVAVAALLKGKTMRVVDSIKQFAADAKDHIETIDKGVDGLAAAQEMPAEGREILDGISAELGALADKVAAAVPADQADPDAPVEEPR